MGAGKLESIILEANENNIDIIGMAEHRWQGKGQFTSRCRGKVLYSGGERAGQNGVAIYLSKRAAQSLMGYNQGSYRSPKSKFHSFSIVFP